MASENTDQTCACMFDSVTSPKFDEKSASANSTFETNENGTAHTFKAVVPSSVQHSHHYSPSISIHSFNLSFSTPGNYNISVNLNGSDMGTLASTAQAGVIGTKPAPESSSRQVQAFPAISGGAGDKFHEPELVNPFGTFIPPPSDQSRRDDYY